MQSRRHHHPLAIPLGLACLSLLPATHVSAAPGSVLTAPTPGSVLTTSTVDFQWRAGSGISQYWLSVGTSQQALQSPPWGNLYTQSTGARTSATVSGIPLNGNTVHVRLWFNRNGSWLFEDSTYGTSQSHPTLTKPAPGATLTTPSVTFEWKAGTGVTQYWLGVATSQQALQSPPWGDLYTQSTGTRTSATVSGIPLNGNAVYVRLWFIRNGSWLFEDSTYGTQSQVDPVLTKPAPGATLTTPSVKFEWSAGTGVAQYRLGVATSQQALQSPPWGDLYGQSTGTQTSATVSGIPLNGNTVYVRLWFERNGSWQFKDSTFSTQQVSATPDWAWDAVLGLPNSEHKFSYWHCGSQASAEAGAQRMADDGYTLVLWAGGPLFSDILGYDIPERIRRATLAANAAHKAGMRLYMKTMSLFHKMAEYPQYEQYTGLSAKSGKTKYTKDSWYSCINVPEIRQAHVVKLAAFLQATGVDGFMTDPYIRPYDGYTCVGKHCRAKFFNETGYVLPTDPGSPFWKNLDDVAYRTWIEWRYKEITEFMQDIQDALSALSPPRHVVQYTGIGVSAGQGPAYDPETMDDNRSVLCGYEIYGAITPPFRWRENAANLQILKSLADKSNVVPYSICTGNRDLHNWALGARIGCRQWSQVQVQVDRERQLDEYLTRVSYPAETLLVRSRNSLTLVDRQLTGDGMYRTNDALQGWAEILMSQNVPFHILNDKDLVPALLARYRVVVLPSVVALSDAVVTALDGFVKQGGRLVVTGMTSLATRSGAKRNDLRLGSLLGVAYNGRQQRTARVALDSFPVPGVTTTQTTNNLLFADVSVTTGQQRARVSAGSSAWPGIVTRQVGSGQTVYLSFAPGRAVFQSLSGQFRSRKGGTWRGNRNPDLQKVMLAALGDERNGLWRPITVPKGVLVSVLNQKTKNRAFVHLLNMRMVEAIPDGTVIPDNYTLPAQPVSSSLEIDVRCSSSITNAYAVSPDFSGRRPVVMNRTGNIVRLQVTGLDNYSVLVLEGATVR